MNFIRTLRSTLAVTGFATLIALPAYSQIVAVGVNCQDRNSNSSQILSAVYDTSTRRLVIYTTDINDDYDHATHVSPPITGNPQYEDRGTPILVSSTRDQSVSRVTFSTKSTIEIQSRAGRRQYFCQGYYPAQLGLRY